MGQNHRMVKMNNLQRCRRGKKGHLFKYWDQFYKRLKILPKFGRERARRFAVSIL